MPILILHSNIRFLFEMRKTCFQKTKIMASSPMTSWQIDGEIMETVRDFMFGGSKITSDVTAARKLKDALK